jgi:hypothetical protein
MDLTDSHHVGYNACPDLRLRDHLAPVFRTRLEPMPARSVFHPFHPFEMPYLIGSPSTFLPLPWHWQQPTPSRKSRSSPLSCVLFNVFINNLFDDMPYPRVEIPRGPRLKPILPAMGLAGLLFADDALGLASTLEETCMLCKHVGDWTEANEMKVGITKCGIMEWGSNGEGGYSNASSLPDPDYDMRLMIGGETVPVVKEYLYLGIMITRSLAIQDLLAPRLASGRKTVYSLAPFLRCPVIPIADRMKVIQGVVLPRLLYGVELYGMCRALTDNMQQLLNTALRSMLRVGSWKSLSSYALWQEFGMKPVCALAAGRRVRAFLKCFELSTWVHQLVAEPFRTRKWTWVTGV